MAPKDAKQRMDNEQNWKDAANSVKKASVGTLLGPDDMDLAVMRLRAAAYAIKQKDMRDVALIHTRDAMVLAFGCFTGVEKELEMLRAKPVTKNGVTQLEPTHVTVTNTIRVTEYKVVASPWTWLKLKLLGRPTVDTTTERKSVSSNEARL